jgi:uncharacterized protein YigA (DUF484 family)
MLPGAELSGIAADPEEALDMFAGALEAGEPACGRLRREQLTYLFDDEGERVASAVLMPLGSQDIIGVMAIGSGDERRYRPGMGTIFLCNLAEVAGQVIESHLAIPRAVREVATTAG